jgi:hypothetical protein
MLTDVFDILFGCWHSRYSFPITERKKGTKPRTPAASVTGTYVVCLDCGKEFPYDWNQMKVLSRVPERAKTAPLTAETATGFSKAA